MSGIMTTKTILATRLIAIASLTFAGIASACDGNACAVITIEKTAGCIMIRNNGNKPVEVREKGALGTINTVYANSTVQPGRPGYPCLADFSDYSANYK
jgi:hypothetical protein